ncbi:hypothetical protein CMV_028311 [Castanea mollissima]|uniref:Uncharacterized protein n=1 Tax=Castanea mollissima TaxID=60419 RepID=A0A8J4Q828_9ROSI|nr:hypothetical protein CMV_028311 [Castanea mollissima]
MVLNNLEKTFSIKKKEIEVVKVEPRIRRISLLKNHLLLERLVKGRLLKAKTVEHSTAVYYFSHTLVL